MNSILTKRPMLIVVSAPSGAGKSTLCNRLLAEFSDIGYSVSCTTRKPRGKEINGINYFFLSENDFRKHIDRNDFLEYAIVHGNYYGTLRAYIIDALSSGKSVIMDIDVQGASQIRKIIKSETASDILKKGFLDIFITPPSLDELRNRLIRRAEDSLEIIEKRLKNAEIEMQAKNEYSYVVVNDNIDKAYKTLVDTIRKESAK